MYRPEIKLLDCTIRDGGLMNNWDFDKALVKDVFEALAEAGVDYVELGYRADKRIFPPDQSGPWRYCDEDLLRSVAHECSTKVSVMCDVGRTNYNDFLPASESIVKMVRVASYVKEIDKAVHLGDYLKDLGYETTVNLMAVSHVLEMDLDEALAQLAGTRFDAVYLVDSFGYLYSQHIHYLAEKYLKALPGKQVGIHCHNNQQLAFANSIDAVVRGINYVDATVYGIGRAAGNCPLELIIEFLRNPKLNVRPVLDLIGKHFIRLQQELQWGYQIPYALAGCHNKHPRSAMAAMKGDGAIDFRRFYDDLLNEDMV